MQPSLPPQLESILQDVSRAFASRLYYPALVVALTLPEICIGLTRDKSSFVKGADYASFIDRYTTEAELGLDGKSCYQLRGGVIHQGNAAGHEYFGVSHVIFSVPESRGGMHGFSIESGESTAAMFDLETFCGAMDRAVRKWFAEHGNDPKVAENLPGLLSWRPDGIHPFVVGAPAVGSGADMPGAFAAFRREPPSTA